MKNMNIIFVLYLNVKNDEKKKQNQNSMRMLKEKIYTT